MKNLILVILLLSMYKIYAQKDNVNNNEVLRIPVAFHIISDSNSKEKPKEAISYSNLKILVQQINANFNQIDKTKLDPLYANIAVNCNIEFYLPTSCENGNNYVTSHDSSIKEFDPDSTDPFIIVGEDLLDTNKYLNICIANIRLSKKWYEHNGSYAKWSPLYKGIIIHPGLFYWDYNDPWRGKLKETKELIIPKVSMATYVLTHELGHAFGLKHIWGGFWSEIFNGCNSRKNDAIGDTPPQKSVNDVFNEEHFDRINNKWKKIQFVCGSNEILGNYQNYMDYSMGFPNGVGMFTEGQKNKMRAVINNREYVQFSECNNKSGYFTDIRDNQTYKWIQIGNLKWMTKNLNYNSNLSSYYNNSSSNGAVYGRLYNWNEANIVCPNGWHLPNKSDWNNMISNIGTHQSKMRSQYGWLNNKNGSNASGLDIYPSGMGDRTGYSGKGKTAKFWLSDSNVFGESREIGGIYGYKDIPKSGANNKMDKLSCRCVSDVSSNDNAEPIPKTGKLRLKFNSKNTLQYTLHFISKDSNFKKFVNGSDIIDLPVGTYLLKISHSQYTKTSRYSSSTKRKTIDKQVSPLVIEKGKIKTIVVRTNSLNTNQTKPRKEGNTLKRIMNRNKGMENYNKNANKHTLKQLMNKNKGN